VHLVSVDEATTDRAAGTEAASAIDLQPRGSSLLLLGRGRSVPIDHDEKAYDKLSAVILRWRG
jgi:hypothetical protein